MASKVLVPTASFAKLQIKKSPPEATSGYVVTTSDPAARVAHLEHSVRFLQEQHRLMLSSLHAEIEALRHRNRDLQFQLIFNRESSPKAVTPAEAQLTEIVENTDQTPEERSSREVARLQREANTARGEARAAEARALQLQRSLDAQAAEIRELSNKKCQACEAAAAGAPVAEGAEGGAQDGESQSRESHSSRVGHGGQSPTSSVEGESRAELRVRLSEAERLVRRLRAEAERARREVACMKNSLQAQLRAGTMDLGYHNSYQFPPLPHEYWPRDHRSQDVGVTRPRRPLTLPDLGHATIYANNHARPRGNFEPKNKRPTNSNTENISPETDNYRKLNERLRTTYETDKNQYYPELKMVITKVLPDVYANNATCSNRPRPRRPRNRPPPEN